MQTRTVPLIGLSSRLCSSETVLERTVPRGEVVHRKDVATAHNVRSDPGNRPNGPEGNQPRNRPRKRSRKTRLRTAVCLIILKRPSDSNGVSHPLVA
jgi:hypothetical protein